MVLAQPSTKLTMGKASKICSFSYSWIRTSPPANVCRRRRQVQWLSGLLFLITLPVISHAQYYQASFQITVTNIYRSFDNPRANQSLTLPGSCVVGANSWWFRVQSEVNADTLAYWDGTNVHTSRIITRSVNLPSAVDARYGAKTGFQRILLNQGYYLLCMFFPDR